MSVSNVVRKHFLCLVIMVAVAVVWQKQQVSFAYPSIPNTTVTLLSDLPLGTAVKGRDGGLSFLFNELKVFTYGDTMLTQPNADGIQWVVNTMYRTSDSDPSNGISGGFNYQTSGQPPRQWIPYTAAETSWNNAHSPDVVALWPSAQFKVGSAQYIWFIKVLEEAGTGWTTAGTGFTKVTSLTSQTSRQQHRPGQAEDYLMFLTAEGGWGNGPAVVSGGYVYVFWVNTDDWGRVRVARALATDGSDSDTTLDFLQRSRWKFRNGSSWVSSASSATPIMDGHDGGGTIEWNSYLNCWLYTYMGYLSTEIRFRVADNLWGPWSAPTTVYAAVPQDGKNPYCARAHKILEQENGRTMYINYSQPLENWQSRVPFLQVRFLD